MDMTTHVYAHADMFVNHVMRRGIGIAHVPELSGLMADILSANIRALRLRTSLDQTQFGELFDVAQGTVSRWEKGSVPRAGQLAQMAEMAGVNIREFMTQLFDDRRVPAVQRRTGAALFLPVQLPSEEALAEMLEGLLEIADQEPDTAMRARTLARLLPDGLQQAADSLMHQGPLAPAKGAGPSDDAPARDDRALPR
jgi:transcriptional regulator with XRE-family HTH domain